MEYSSIIPRQLAPTVGQRAAGVRNRARSAFGAIGTTMAVGMVSYFSNLPYILPDTYTPAVRGINRSAIVPIGSLDFYVGWTDEESAAEWNGVNVPTQPAPLADAEVEDRSTPARVETIGLVEVSGRSAGPASSALADLEVEERKRPPRFEFIGLAEVCRPDPSITPSAQIARSSEIKAEEIQSGPALRQGAAEPPRSHFIGMVDITPMDFGEDGDSESLLCTINESMEDGELSDYSAHSADLREWEEKISSLIGSESPSSAPKEVFMAARKNSAAAKAAAAAAESAELVEVQVMTAEKAAEAARIMPPPPPPPRGQSSDRVESRFISRPG